jgi:hypothetical protein
MNLVRYQRKVVPGARIELATPAFSGRRSTTELPRQLWSRNCMGCSAIVSIRCHCSDVLYVYARLADSRERNSSSSAQ